MKILNFVWGVIFFILSVVLSLICRNLLLNIQDTSGVAALSFIVTIPLVLILYVVLLSFLAGAVFNTIRAIFSDIIAIKIISIVLIVLEVAVLIIDIFTFLKFLG